MKAWQQQFQRLRAKQQIATLDDAEQAQLNACLELGRIANAEFSLQAALEQLGDLAKEAVLDVVIPDYDEESVLTPILAHEKQRRQNQGGNGQGNDDDQGSGGGDDQGGGKPGDGNEQ
jgi:uncharacterized membrane protein YgcG